MVHGQGEGADWEGEQDATKDAKNCISQMHNIKLWNARFCSSVYWMYWIFHVSEKKTMSDVRWSENMNKNNIGSYLRMIDILLAENI